MCVSKTQLCVFYSTKKKSFFSQRMVHIGGGSRFGGGGGGFHGGGGGFRTGSYRNRRSGGGNDCWETCYISFRVLLALAGCISTLVSLIRKFVQN